MKKTLFVLRNTSIIYWSCYVIKTFVIWKFTNPFFWIIEMPNYSSNQRADGLFLAVVSIGIIAKVSIEYLKIEEEEKNYDNIENH